MAVRNVTLWPRGWWDGVAAVALVLATLLLTPLGHDYDDTLIVLFLRKGLYILPLAASTVLTISAVRAPGYLAKALGGAAILLFVVLVLPMLA
jgi:hypothetical protein